MNSIKNAVVTVTLLAVGYGAYVVLNNPPDRNFSDFPSHAEPGLEPANDLPSLEIETDGVAASTTNTSPQLATELPNLPDPQPPISAAAPESRRESVYSAAVPPREIRAETGIGPTDERGPDLNLTHPELNAGTTDSRFTDDAPEGLVDLPPTGQVSEQNESSQFTSTDSISAPSVENNFTDPPAANSSIGPIPPSEGTSAGGGGPFEQAWQTTQQHLSDGNLVQALATLSPWCNEQSLSEEQRNRCLNLLDQLAGTVIYSRQHLLETEYEVRAGETLEEIAGFHRVPLDLLAKINGIAPPYALTTGERMKVVRGPFRAEVSLEEAELTLFLGQYYAGRFPVRIGRDLPAQEAFYEVTEKSNGRSYFDRQSGREVLKGEAANRYGEHWLGLRGDQITAGHQVGIHGRSHGTDQFDIGSISLDPVDVADVFSILSVGSRVQVRR